MKKNITKIAIALFFVLLVVANFALANSVTIPTIKQVQGGKAESLVGQILGLLQFAAVAIALAMLLIIGIKYITASPEGKADIKGKYKIIAGENKETVPVTYSSGTLHYESDIDPLFDEGILNLAVSRDYFASLDVEKTFKSAETELREIIYQPENHSKLYKYLKNKYDLPEDTNCRVRIKHSSGGIYRTSIQMKSITKSIQIDLRVFEN